LLSVVQRSQIALADAFSETPTDLEKRIELALAWWERAQLATEQVVRLRYLFTALEAIFGDKRERLKGAPLALRRAVLGLIVSDGMAHPARIYSYYDEIRSAAVHGEPFPAISEREEIAFAWDVRRAIGEAIQISRSDNLSKRTQLHDMLDNDERRANIEQALIEQAPRMWGGAPDDDGRWRGREA
jgi:hypothetical protein